MKKMSCWGIAIMFVLFLLSILFFEQRAYLLDFSFIVNLIVENNSVQIQEYRYGSFITHLFPLIANKLGASYTATLFTYNLSFYTFFLVTYLLLYFRFKQYHLCLLFLAYHLVFVGDVFFWSNNEVHQGIAWAFLGLGYYSSIKHKYSNFNWQYIPAIVLLGLGLYTHLLVAIPILLIVSFDIIKDNGGTLKTLQKKQLILPLITLVVLALRYIQSSMGGYDGSKLSVLGKLTFGSAFSSLMSDHARSFYKTLTNVNVLVVPLLVLGIWLLIKQKSKWYITIFSTCLIACWMLINLVYPYPMDKYLHFYMESEYMIMGIILLIPMVYFLQYTEQARRVLSLSFSILFVVCMVKIGNGYQFFSDRKSNLEALITYCNNHNIDKGIVIIPKEESKKYFIMDWVLPVETISLSYKTTGKPISVKLVDSAQFEALNFSQIHNANYIDCFGISDLHHRKTFPFPLSSTQPYTIINKQDIINELKPL